MPEPEKKLAESLVEISRALPDDKKEFLFGFVEGVAAMANLQKESEGVSQSRA